MTALDFAILGFAAWRLAYLLARESGPYDVLVRLRAGARWALRSKEKPEQPGCVLCVSVWTAIGLFALWQVIQWPVIMLAIAGLAAAVDEYAG